MEGGDATLSAEYRTILGRSLIRITFTFFFDHIFLFSASPPGAADQLREDFRDHPAHLQRLCGMVTDLYIDKFKFKVRLAAFTFTPTMAEIDYRGSACSPVFFFIFFFLPQQGLNVKSRVPLLIEELNHFELPRLLVFFDIHP
jgi:hypothetical protein